MSIAFGTHSGEFRLGREPPAVTVISEKSTFAKMPKDSHGFTTTLELFADTGIVGKGATEMYSELTDDDYKTLFSKNPLLIKQATTGGIMGPLARAVPGLGFRAPFQDEMKWDLDMSMREGRVHITLTGEGDAALIAIEEGKVEEARELLLQLTAKASIAVKGGSVTGVLFIPKRFLSKEV